MGLDISEELEQVSENGLGQVATFLDALGTIIMHWNSAPMDYRLVDFVLIRSFILCTPPLG